MELNEKHKRFIDEYLTDLNATRAYQAVYDIKDKRTAQAASSRLLSKVMDSDYFRSALERCQLSKHMEQDEVLIRYAAIARREPYEEIYESYDTSSKKEKIKTKSRYLKTPTITESIMALEAIAKYYQLFTQSVDLNVKSITFVDDVPLDDDD
ncbi:terminase small subunit [Melissococcus plutonius]|uniref:terminase small subunit n=1 Tax=Melissococcus plutonius TaxID=33970 RepID=UPI0021E549BA|nr:terminase small subunit [Melissococcus plutonius]MCV2499579.1 terminase small subunit [Melissococcus plutonius]MCV2501741.1 terminase small subunit [Melissococcus plutonius]MCV2505949.1 terminase small subunit [Melissococcus plutonius]MCV2508191.1 terminase small subunit [Melissococcus plutonius]MCV2528033.1 terminase small subunit [Melissococcus plutonius]